MKEEDMVQATGEQAAAAIGHPDSAPRRVQRKRVKGWKMPANAVYVGRPGRFGNPFDWMIYGRETATDFYRRWLLDDLTVAERRSTGIDLPDFEAQRRMKLEILDNLQLLSGKNLCCWCALDRSCHADVLLELANAPPSAHG